MNNFELSEKIHCFDVLKGIFSKRNKTPFVLLIRYLGLDNNWTPYYFNWGRNALYFLFKSLPYKRITFPAFTCPTLTEAAYKAGKGVTLTEINPDTYNLDIDKIPENTECLVVVHTFGNPVDISKIRHKHKKIFIIEDCAHAIFSQINNQYVGNKGDAVLFSLYKQIPNVNGCMLLVKKNTKSLVDSQKKETILQNFTRLLIKINGPHQLILNIKKSSYLPIIEKHDLNDNLPSNLVFSVFEYGISKLKKEVIKRRSLVKYYRREIEKSKFLDYQKPEKNCKSSYYHFAVSLHPKIANHREQIVMQLRHKGIFIDRLWPITPILQNFINLEHKNYSHALLLTKSIINLPIYSFYSQKAIKRLFSKVNESINSY